MARVSRRRRRPSSPEQGAAIADFVMVTGLLTLLFIAVLQVGLALHVRNTLIACASEGARYGARADSSPARGAERAQELIGRSVSPRFAEHVSAGSETVGGGVQVVVVRVDAPLPLIGLFGPQRLQVTGRAFAEIQ